MKVYRHAREVERSGRAVCAAIGVFDGVHRGHQEVIRHAVVEAEKRQGLALVITFDVHPSSVVAPERAPRLIQPLAQRLHEIEKLGVNAALLQAFTPEFSQITGQEFISSLSRDLGAVEMIAVGESFSFGRGRSGNVSVLKELGSALQFSVQPVPAVQWNGAVVSSTRIRQAIREGDLALAAMLLGRPYSVRSNVQRGDQLGRQLGFPTANLDVSGLELPPFGVYTGTARFGNESHRAVANIGVRPSVSNVPTPRFEAHLLDYTGDLYGSELEFVFERQLRTELKFDSLDALKAQIARDVIQAQA